MRYGITLGAIIIGMAFAGCEPTDVLGVSSDAACNIDYTAIKANEMIEIEAGLSIYTHFVLEQLSEDDLSEAEIASLDRMQAILDSHNRPVDRQDLMILDSANAQLSDPLVWDRADDRTCEPQMRHIAFIVHCILAPWTQSANISIDEQ